MLVTGADGMVGRAVRRKLEQASCDVVPLTRRAPMSSTSSSIVLDLSEQSLVDRLCFVPDAIVHLAAAMPRGRGTVDTESLAECTRRIDETVVRAAEAWGSILIYASGCSLYDPRDPTTKTERSAVSASTPYLGAKLDGEIAAGRLARSCVLRLSSPAGPGMDPVVVLARFVEQARANEPIEVWGNGSREQDFIATSDVAEFVAAAIERGVTGIYNVASGRPTTMLELAEAVRDRVGAGVVRVGVRPDPLAGGTARFSIAAAETGLGWRPRVSLADVIPKHGFEFRAA